MTLLSLSPKVAWCGPRSPPARIFFSSTLRRWLPYSRIGLAASARSTLSESVNTMNPKFGT